MHEAEAAGLKRGGEALFVLLGRRRSIMAQDSEPWTKEVRARCPAPGGASWSEEQRGGLWAVVGSEGRTRTCPQDGWRRGARCITGISGGERGLCIRAGLRRPAGVALIVQWVCTPFPKAWEIRPLWWFGTRGPCSCFLHLAHARPGQALVGGLGLVLRHRPWAF
ncbi:hypothetical protein K438DRAFT_1941762 [Mycena galopus ATCC 62051]|nr:hypothetical protein K438DRAFT_1941762 [Mycena galopus ATCC 62051]